MPRLNFVNLPHLKSTDNSKTVSLPLPKTVKIPMLMHMGEACIPCVKVGDSVKIGQKIGDSDAFCSVPVHSGVSGTVKSITDYHFANTSCKAVLIECDGNQSIFEEISPPVFSNHEEFVAAIRESGCCGLGGAGFPTHIKLSPKTKIDTLIINAAECEPYITSDDREMIEYPDDIISGISLVMKMLDIPKAVIGIESNKPKAIEIMKQKTASMQNVSVISLPIAYPQGAEKVIIYASTKRIIDEGEIPSDKGVIVLNVSTVSFINKYCETGMPLVSRRLTIEGDCAGKPQNIEAPVGTAIKDILEFTGADFERITTLVEGGPMMGISLASFEDVVIKTSNAFLALSRSEKMACSACIRCGRCSRVCPINLMPNVIEQNYIHRDIDALKKLKVVLCFNCGSCTYICPAGRPLAETNQLAKEILCDKATVCDKTSLCDNK